MRLVRLDSAGRKRMLRTGLLGVSLHVLWRGDPPGTFEPWEYPLFTLLYFVMGVHQVLAGITGLYVEDLTNHLAYWHLRLHGWLDRAIGAEKDPSMSRRIIDPRWRMAALEAIEESRKMVRRGRA